MTSRISQRSSLVQWTPAALVAVCIWYWSIVTSPPAIAGTLESPATTADAPTRAAFATALELAWFDLRHGMAYAALALSLEYPLADRDTPVSRVRLLVFCVTVGYGGLMEVGQLFRPDRVASVADAASNAVGAGVALAPVGVDRRSGLGSARSSDEP